MSWAGEFQTPLWAGGLWLPAGDVILSPFASCFFIFTNHWNRGLCHAHHPQRPGWGLRGPVGQGFLAPEGDGGHWPVLRGGRRVVQRHQVRGQRFFDDRGRGGWLAAPNPPPTHSLQKVHLQFFTYVIIFSYYTYVYTFFIYIYTLCMYTCIHVYNGCTPTPPPHFQPTNLK